MFITSNIDESFIIEIFLVVSIHDYRPNTSTIMKVIIKRKHIKIQDILINVNKTSVHHIILDDFGTVIWKIS